MHSFADWQREPRAFGGPCLHSLSWRSVRRTSAGENYPEISRAEQQRGAFVFLLPRRDQRQPLQAAVQEPHEQHRAVRGGEGGGAGRGCCCLRVQHPGEKLRDLRADLKSEFTGVSVPWWWQKWKYWKEEADLSRNTQRKHPTNLLIVCLVSAPPAGFWWLAENAECHNRDGGPIQERRCPLPFNHHAVHCGIMCRTGHYWSRNICLVVFASTCSWYAHTALYSRQLMQQMKSSPKFLSSINYQIRVIYSNCQM